MNILRGLAVRAGLINDQLASNGWTLQMASWRCALTPFRSVTIALTANVSLLCLVSSHMMRMHT